MCLWTTVFTVSLAALGVGCGTPVFAPLWGPLMQRRDSSHGAWALECAGFVLVVHGLSCSLTHGILVPWPGIEPTSPALQGWILTIRPPGKSG